MRRPYFQVYADRKGEHRWRLRAANHRIIAESGEGYSSEAKAWLAIRTVKLAVARGEADAVQRVRGAQALGAGQRGRTGHRSRSQSVEAAGR